MTERTTPASPTDVIYAVQKVLLARAEVYRDSAKRATLAGYTGAAQVDYEAVHGYELAAEYLGSDGGHMAVWDELQPGDAPK